MLSGIDWELNRHFVQIKVRQYGQHISSLFSQNCCIASWNTLFARITMFPTNLYRSKNSVASWGNMLRKVDSSSTFCNKFKFCYSFYHWSYNMPHRKFEFNAGDWLWPSRSAATWQIKKKKKTWRKVKTSLNSKLTSKSRNLSICPVQRPEGSHSLWTPRLSPRNNQQTWKHYLKWHWTLYWESLSGTEN